jgi:hypothetical protein
METGGVITRDETPEGYFKAFEDGVNVDIEVDNMVDDVDDEQHEREDSYDA